MYDNRKAIFHRKELQMLQEDMNDTHIDHCDLRPLNILAANAETASTCARHGIKHRWMAIDYDRAGFHSVRPVNWVFF